MLDDIMPGKRGKLVLTGNKVSYEISPFAEKEHAKATKLYSKCSASDVNANVVLNTLISPTYNSLCGYTTNANHITKINYFIGEKR